MEESNKNAANEQLMKERQQIRYLYTAEELDQRIRQKMAQSNQEISELRNNALLAKQEMDKLKADYQKLAMALNCRQNSELKSTRMEESNQNHHRERIVELEKQLAVAKNVAQQQYLGKRVQLSDVKRLFRRMTDLDVRRQEMLTMAKKCNMCMDGPTQKIWIENEGTGGNGQLLSLSSLLMPIPLTHILHYNIREDSGPKQIWIENNKSDNCDGQMRVRRWMPLELHCEWFACLPLFFQKLLIPELCRGIYAIKGKEVKRILLKLLNKWQHWDTKKLEVSADRRTVKHIGEKNGCAVVRAARPFSFQSSSQCQMRGHRICYFEVKIVVMKYGGILIGLCYKRIGKNANSFAIRSNGDVWMENVNVESNSDWRFGQGDVIGCGLEIGAAVDGGQKMHLFFTRNGKICGNSFQMPASANGVKLFPAVSLLWNDDQIEANFGNLPFMYDLTKHNSAQQKR